jgi:hypothetical protein
VVVGSTAIEAGASTFFAERHISVVGDLILMAGGDDDWGAVKIYRDQPGGDPVFLGEFRVIDLPGSKPTGASRRIESAGTVAFLADSGAGLIVLDISDPTDPRMLDTDVTATPADDLALLSNDRLLVTATCSKLRVFDLANPAAPVARGELALSGTGSACQVRVAASGSTAYVAGDQAVIVIDVTSPESPTVIGRFEIGGQRARDVKVAGNVAYIGTEVGLAAVDITNPQFPVVVGHDGSGMYFSFEIDGSRAVARRDSQGTIDMFDLGADGRSPVHVGVVFVSSISSFDVAGSRLHVVRPNDGLVTFNISNPASPNIIGDVDGDQWRASQIDVRGTTAYIRNFDQGFAIFDLSDPSQPVLIGSYSDGKRVTGFVVEGPLAYLTQTTSNPIETVELVVLDIGNPSLPRKLGSITGAIGEGIINDLAVGNGFVFGVVLGTEKRGFTFDVVDPAAPVFVGLGIGDWRGEIDHVEAAGERLYFAHGYLGLRLGDTMLRLPQLALDRAPSGSPRPLEMTWDAPAGVPFSIEFTRDFSSWQPIGRHSDQGLDGALGIAYDPAPGLEAFFRVPSR